MSVPPTDDGPDPGGFQSSQAMPHDQPSAQSPQPSYTPYQPYPAQPYPVNMDGIPPKRPKPIRTILILVVCLIAAGVVAGAVVSRFNREPMYGAQSSFAPVPIPPAVLPLDISSTTVVEAIDVPTRPTLGPIWDAADTDENSGYMTEQYFVTPCGVLVTAITSSYDYPGHGASSRLVGYEIATGAKAWTVPLQDLTGLRDPTVYYTGVSYTPDCRMVVTLGTTNRSDFTETGIMVDLSTGHSVVLTSSEDLSWCTATGAATAACFGDDQVQIVGEQGVVRSLPITTMYRYPYNGDIVVNGMVWSDTGYTDPITGDVVFGTDITDGGAFDEWVTYREASLPGGYASGVALRLEGTLEQDSGTCTLMAWDTTADRGLWAAPVSLTCDMRSWTVAGSALVVADDNNDMWAFSLVDGSLMWDKTARPYATAWSRANSATLAHALGVTDDFALFEDLGNTQEILSIATGDDVPTPFPAQRWTTLTLSPTIGYAYGYGDAYARTLAAYSLTGGTSDPVWTVPLPGDSSGAWTFATGGTMYIVCKGDDGSAWVSPLTEG